MSQAIQKVTALITRGLDDRPAELLVFRHPTAGVQLPAGTVEADEAVETALLREVAEETGLTQVRLSRHLGTLTRALDSERRAVLSEVNLLLGPAQASGSLNFTLRRGNWVRVIGEIGPFSEVVWEEYDLNTDPPQPRARISGWLPTEVLATRLERHFYHLTPSAPTPETWQAATDGHIFTLYWRPLSPKPKLVTGQDEWLDWVYDQLVASL